MRLAHTHGTLAALAALGAVLATRTPGTFAQPPPADARQVAAAVQSFYEQTRGVRARFHQTYYERLYDRYRRSHGTVLFVKPGRMRWDYAEPRGKVIASDGRLLRYLEPASGGLAASCVETEVDEDQLPAAFSFLTGVGRLEQSFSFRLLDRVRHGYPEGFVLELRSLQPSPHFERILLYVPEHQGRAAGVVRRVLIVDAEGNRNRFDFSEMQWNPSATDALFRVQPPRGVRCTRP
ncbi:MAG: outer membrane lipoprotein carrier protein LolA [Myxococcota bacterium]|nr:outer membrane lipoprotein carrier protein LolA [Myxococcota bacterium]MDW8361103.1 outer membrane lipoprotein carrier protein LolA [Myxococcales bacterium]